MSNLQQLKADNAGTLPAFAWPGGYPIIYVFADGEVCCPACANGENGSIATLDLDDSTADGSWQVVGFDIHYEGPPEHCAHCNAEIESAYGDPDDEEAQA